MGYCLSSQFASCSGAPGKHTQNPQTGSRTVESGYRFYNPETGRWLNRDPLDEKGAVVARAQLQPIFDETLGSRTYSEEVAPWVPSAEGTASPIVLYADARGLALPSEYWFVANDPVSNVDPRGLRKATVGWAERQKWPFGGHRYPHWALTLYGRSYGFGPKRNLTVGTTSGYGHVSKAYTEWAVVELTVWGKLKYGAVKMDCACATRDDRIACANYYNKEWDNTFYLAGIRDCRSFALEVLNKCCFLKRTSGTDVK